MVLKNRNIESIMEDYLFLTDSVRSKKYQSVKKAREAVVDSKNAELVDKNVELVEELLDLEDQIKRERAKILDLEHQIKNHKGLTDLQYYQSYLRACAADNYINEHEKKGLEIQRKNRNITPEQHIQVLKNLCISLEEYEQMLKPKRTGTDMCASCMNNPREIVLLPCRHLVLCEGCSVGEGGKHITCPKCGEEARETIKAFWN